MPAVNRVNEIRFERGIAPLPKITPHALRCTYISLMLEAGAPLPYVMDQVGHADSKTTLEVYAQVQKRISRKNLHAAFDRLFTGGQRRDNGSALTRRLGCDPSLAVDAGAILLNATERYRSRRVPT